VGTHAYPTHVTHGFGLGGSESNQLKNVPVKHFTKVLRKANTRDKKGRTIKHFKCIYRDKEGLSSSSILTHLRKCYPMNYPELLTSTNQDVLKPMRPFSEPKIKRQVFDEDFFVGIKWIIITIESVYLQDVLVYLDAKAKDHLCSRRTLIKSDFFTSEER
jgi:hypothetical protein